MKTLIPKNIYGYHKVEKNEFTNTIEVTHGYRLLYLFKNRPGQTMRKIKITRSLLPGYSSLPVSLAACNYIDSYQSSLIDGDSSIGPAEVGKAFFASAPAWIENLLTFRNKIVSLAGLKTGDDIKDKKLILENFHCTPGEQVGLFTVLLKTEHEVIFGEDDKHLDFRVSFFLSKPVTGMAERQLTISTAVKFNNWFGKLYFLPVKPFHRFIVPAMLKATINQLERTNPIK